MSYKAVENAIASGRILPRSRKKYERLMRVNPKQTKKFLNSLAPVLAGRDTDELADLDDTAYPTAGLTPRERERIAASSYDTAASAAASPAPPQRSAPRASAPIPPTDEAYPPEWLNPSERIGATGHKAERGNVTFDAD